MLVRVVIKHEKIVFNFLPHRLMFYLSLFSLLFLVHAVLPAYGNGVVVLNGRCAHITHSWNNYSYIPTLYVCTRAFVYNTRVRFYW